MQATRLICACIVLLHVQDFLTTLGLQDAPDRVVVTVEGSIQLKTLEVDTFAHHSAPMPKLVQYLDRGGCSEVYLAGANLPLGCRGLCRQLHCNQAAHTSSWLQPS